MFKFRVLTVAISCGALTVLAAFPSGFSAGAKGPTHLTAYTRIVPPSKTYDGKTYRQWAARYTKWYFDIPASMDPGADTTGADCGVDQAGPVWFLEWSGVGTVTRACTIPDDKAIWIPISTTAALSYPPPYNLPAPLGPGLVDMYVDTDTGLHLSVDGRPVAGLAPAGKINSWGGTSSGCPWAYAGRFLQKRPSFCVGTRRLTWRLPGGPGQSDNGGSGGFRTTGVNEGHFVLLRPLGTGAHTVVFGATRGPVANGYKFQVTYDLTICSHCTGSTAAHSARGEAADRSVAASRGLMVAYSGRLAAELKKASAGSRAGDAGVVPPSAKYRGKSYMQWAGRWTKWFFDSPTSTDPLSDTTGADCGLDQSGPAWFLGSTDNSSGGDFSRSCTIPDTKAIFVEIAGGWGNNAPPPWPVPLIPGFIAADVDTETAVHLSVDGHAIGGLAVGKVNRWSGTSNGCPWIYAGRFVQKKASFCVGTRRLTWTLPGISSSNYIGGPGGFRQTSVAEGTFVMLKPLAPGDHTIVLGATVPYFGYASPFQVTYHLTICSHCSGTPPPAVARGELSGRSHMSTRREIDG